MPGRNVQPARDGRLLRDDGTARFTNLPFEENQNTSTTRTTMSTFACCSRSCRSVVVDPQLDAWVRVRLDIHNGTTQSSDRRQWPMHVHEGTGVASLHQTCWETLQQEHARGRSKFGRLLQQARDTAEFFDCRDQIQARAVTLAHLLQDARHAVVFTGAGISTAAGIGDFRGLFGQWTEHDMTGPDNDGNDDGSGVPYEHLRPTLAHEALCWLVQNGMLKYVVTQNCDGLHRMSGIPAAQLSELHGNIFVEYCRQCGTEFERHKDVCDDAASLYFEELEEHGHTNRRKPKAVQCPNCRLTHQTRRKCPSCKKPLHDTIINFGDDLRVSELAPAREQTKKADLILVLGSTLTVTPAAHLCKTRERLVICNRQETARDSFATLRVHGDCDGFMAGVLKELMGEVSYKEWVDARKERMKTYDKLRNQKR